mmetsp:Transcript_32297/g.39669  ORF Transcript_32297/g.39669 Transcript_32297/m.39669 type:complete len:250 (+) Transcript_32297:145-894(+)
MPICKVITAILFLLTSSSSAFAPHPCPLPTTQMRAHRGVDPFGAAFGIGAASIALTLGAANPAVATVATTSVAQEATVTSSEALFPMQQALTTMTMSSIERELGYGSSSFLISAATVPATNSASTTAATANVANAGVTISDIYFNGQVPKTEADEYVVITNTSKSPVDISKYYVYVATTGTQGPTFTFPKDTTLKPNSSVRIYTNEIHKETGGFSFGSGKAIWSNNGGLAVLKDGNGKKITEFKYKPSS